MEGDFVKPPELRKAIDEVMRGPKLCKTCNGSGRSNMIGQEPAICVVCRGTGISLLDNVISIEDHMPHETQSIRCFKCNHDWVAVFPEGTTELECPNCHVMTPPGPPTNGGAIMRTDNIDLKPCPFCASTDVHNERYAMINARSQVVFMGCGALSREADSKEEAAALWNKRATTEEQS